jgi:hypothetical protein
MLRYAAITYGIIDSGTHIIILSPRARITTSAALTSSITSRHKKRSQEQQQIPNSSLFTSVSQLITLTSVILPVIMSSDSYDIHVTLTPSRQRIDKQPPRPFLELEDFNTSSSDHSFESDSDVSSPSASSEGDGNISGTEVRCVYQV